jgi:YD repeat-containing protein
MNYTTHDQWTSLVPTSLTYPNGRQVSSGYDALYRRNTIHETSGGASIAAWQFFGSRTAKQTLGNGITASMMNNAGTNSAVQAGVPNPAWGDKTTDRLGYDGSGRMIAKRFLPSGSTTSRVGFTTAYDPSSNKLFERALHAESRSALYPAYDSMDRLVEYQRGIVNSR